MNPGPTATKYIFVTGGVVSSLGKGIAAASLGRLLVERGLQRHDAEVRPVPQRRSRHDVAVPARRGLRHRRRRRDRPRPRPLRAVHRPLALAGRTTSPPAGSTRRSSTRSGAANTSAARCRSFRTSPTRSRPPSAALAPEHDVVIIEIGGTVGDIESLPFLEAIRQFRHEVGRENALVHPPDARAVHRGRRRAQDQADAALGPRADADRYSARHPHLPHRAAASPTTSSARSRCSATSTSARDREPRRQRRSTRSRSASTSRASTAWSASGSRLETTEPDLHAWQAIVAAGARSPRDQVRIAVVGKYTELIDAYKSVQEALIHGGIANDVGVEIEWIASDRFTDQETAAQGAARRSTACWCPAASASAASRAWSRRFAGPARTACRSSASASACRSRSSSSPATSAA